MVSKAMPQDSGDPAEGGLHPRPDSENNMSEKRNLSHESPDQEALAHMIILRSLLGWFLLCEPIAKMAPFHRCPFVSSSRLEKGTGHIRALIAISCPQETHPAGPEHSKRPRQK